jgi:hypothetical protein
VNLKDKKVFAKGLTRSVLEQQYVNAWDGMEALTKCLADQRDPTKEAKYAALEDENAELRKLLQIARGGLADISLARDLTLDNTRTKAKRVYEDSTPEEDKSADAQKEKTE